jgi:hypothetical protein
LLFQELGSRKVVADFSGGTFSSDGGVLLLRQVDLSLGLTRRLTRCFGDQRQPIFVERSLPELLAQRNHVYLPLYAFVGNVPVWAKCARVITARPRASCRRGADRRGPSASIWEKCSGCTEHPFSYEISGLKAGSLRPASSPVLSENVSTGVPIRFNMETYRLQSGVFFS